jgi:hypothetical protein
MTRQAAFKGDTVAVEQKKPFDFEIRDAMQQRTKKREIKSRGPDLGMENHLIQRTGGSLYLTLPTRAGFTVSAAEVNSCLS